ncbi:hypothetical protein LTR12_011744, partial [Friedmanniomyces endolithicus]
TPPRRHSLQPRRHPQSRTIPHSNHAMDRKHRRQRRRHHLRLGRLHADVRPDAGSLVHGGQGHDWAGDVDEAWEAGCGAGGGDWYCGADTCL